MKYKVVGWTDYDGMDVLSSKGTIGFAERNAIIDEIKKHKYLFSGYDHQEHSACVPVLNDGKKRCFSQRGWGGVMAEAYGEMGDLDYAMYTFHGSISKEYVKHPDDDFDVYSFTPKVIENEHFKVEVSRELFEIAKTKNPFYLDDLDTLRFIDANDTLTLECDGEKLDFIIADIDRNKKNLGFKEHNLISTTYKIIVTHKPIACKKTIQRKPVIVNYYTKDEMFNKCIEEYDYSVLYEILDNWNIKDIETTKSIKVKKVLKQFLLDYILDEYKDGVVVTILEYINDYSFYEDMAYKLIDSPSILKQFVRFYSKKGKLESKHILNLIKNIKDVSKFDLDLIYKAIELSPNKVAYRKKYYNATKYLTHSGFALMAGLDLYGSIKKRDINLVNLENYENMNDDEVLFLAELLTLDGKIKITKNNYPYTLPDYLTLGQNLIYDGVRKYKEYVKSKIDLESKYVDILMHGICRKCKDMDEYLDGEHYSAVYTYALDVLSGFKYDLYTKAKNLYVNKEFHDSLDSVYNYYKSGKK